MEILLANPLVSDVLCIKGKIPLIKMKFDTVSVDLLCGVVALPYVPEVRDFSVLSSTQWALDSNEKGFLRI